jgi:small conductance mechanosensitive channel
MQNLIAGLDPDQLIDMLLGFIPKATAALIVLLAFWLVLRITRPTLKMILRRAEFSDVLVRLLVDNVYRFTLIGLALVMAASQLGINVAAALAGIGVLGIAVGFAAQDSIANTIAGFLIFWDKPFQVGDVIKTQGLYGVVRNITMRTTRIRTPSNTFVILPNRKIIEDVLVNHSMFGETRVDVPVGIAYKEDIREARRVILEALPAVEGLQERPEPTVVVNALGDSSVNLSVRVWVDDATQELPVRFRVVEACKLALDAAGIQIPFPHLQLFVDDVEDRVWSGAARVPALARSGGDS